MNRLLGLKTECIFSLTGTAMPFLSLIEFIRERFIDFKSPHNGKGPWIGDQQKIKMAKK